MSEIDPLLEELAEMRSRNRFVGNMFTNWTDPEKERLVSALEAVLAIPEETYLPTSSKGYFHSGRNSMRDDIRTAITQALGVEQ